MSNLNKPVLVQGDREIFPEDIDHIRTTLRQFSSLSRSEVIDTLCEHLNWLTPAGLPKTTACTKLLNRLEEQDIVRLPAKRKRSSHPGLCAQSAPRETGLTGEQVPLEMPLAELGPIRLAPVIEKAAQRLWNDYVQRYHYLGYKKPFGYVQRYFIEAGSHRLGCVLLSGPAKALTARDRWIGWSDRQRLKNLPWVLNNSRFLLFPWVHVANLASHVLGQLARRVADDFKECWGYRPVLMETFVDPAQFHGGCYRAAGWELLGRTTGEGLVRPGKQYKTTPKLIFAKPLQKNFRRLLCSEQLQGRTEL
ncbi:MAG: DUF4338 domain-containing protein [Gammaproteobacteria bacterium]|nr:DUF4338 domain-containing protein [Gammaproteobacteria bacterium]